MVIFWVIILIIWIAQVVMRLTVLKDTDHNSMWLGLSGFWIALSVLNIINFSFKEENLEKEQPQPVVIQQEDKEEEIKDIEYSTDGIYYYVEEIY